MQHMPADYEKEFDEAVELYNAWLEQKEQGLAISRTARALKKVKDVLTVLAGVCNWTSGLYKHHPHSGLKRALKHLKGTTHEQRILVAFASDLP